MERLAKVETEFESKGKKTGQTGQPRVPSVLKGKVIRHIAEFDMLDLSIYPAFEVCIQKIKNSGGSGVEKNPI